MSYTFASSTPIPFVEPHIYEIKGAKNFVAYHLYISEALKNIFYKLLF